MTDWIQPFVKLGYGWSWYKLKNVSLNGAYITPQDSDWVEQPGLFPLRNILPNEWTLGGGLELIPINQHGEFLNGLDYGIKLEISYTTQTVDVDFAAPLELGLPPPSPSTSRLGISLIGVISL
jgi:hypothetical protein